MADSIFNSNVAGAYSATTLPAYNVAQANADLDAAGWNGTPSGGFRTSLGVAGLTDGTVLRLGLFHNFVSTNTGTEAYAQLFKSDMAAIGVDIFDRNGNGTAGSTNNAGSGSRNFELSQVSYCNGDDPVIGVQRSYLSSQITASFLSNLAGYR